MSELSLDIVDNSALFVEALAPIASFLTLREILVCRLTCVEGLNQLHASLTVVDCADLLSSVLQSHRVMVMGNVTKWRDAGNDAFDVLQCLQQLDTSSTNPLNTLLRTMRALSHIPSQLAACYSGKYGRFCAPCQTQSGSMQMEAFSKCSRGKLKCSTCALKIPPRVTCGQEENDDRREEQTNEYSEGGEEEKSADELSHNEILDIYSVLSIKSRHKNRSQGIYSIDLENFYCKCVPNIPSDLICPICRENTQRTLLLSAFSYQSDLSASREQPGHMSISFTPLLESKTKRARTQPFAEISDGFPPPEYCDMFLPNTSGGLLLRQKFRQDCKHAISIHCTSCQKFGLIAAARICMPCHLRLDESAKSVGAVLFRPKAENASQMHCYYCTQRPDTESEESDEASEVDDDDDDDDNDDDDTTDVSVFNRYSHYGGFSGNHDEEEVFECGYDDDNDGDYY